jgi:rod shape-determining protein MreD
MLRKIVLAFGAWILFLLQCAVFPKFNLGGIVPNLLIVLICSVGFMRGEKEGMVVGFFSGLLLDIFFGNLLGLNALLLLYVGYLNGQFCGLFYAEDIRLPMTLIMTSEFTYGFFFYVFSFLIRGRLNLGFYMTHIILPEVLYTIIISIFLYPIILKIDQTFEHHKDRSGNRFV